MTQSVRPLNENFRYENNVLNLSIGMIAAIVAWSGFILVTVRKFWKSPDDTFLTELYREVKVGGLLLTGVFSLISATTIDLPKFPFWPEVVYWVIICFPVTMWFTYLGLLAFQAFADRQ